LVQITTSSFKRNLVAGYLPTAIAMLIEPIWILINRLLCILQPLGALKGLDAKASGSISLNYNSLPPQLSIIPEARARHYLLTTVCGMALLANLLTASFAGLVYQNTVPITHK
jgi:hypothetical protein